MNLSHSSRSSGRPIPRRVNNSFIASVLDGAAQFFSNFCHTLGAAFLRVLSTLVLMAGVCGAVALNMVGFYYLGAANPHPLIASVLYLPALTALSLLREEVLQNGTSSSGVGAAHGSHAVAISYLTLIASAFLSVLHPLWLRGGNYISGRSMWTCLGATGWLYFMLLFSSLAYASSLNMYRSGTTVRDHRDEEDALYICQADVADVADKDEDNLTTSMPELTAATADRGPYDDVGLGPYDAAFSKS